MSCHHLSGGQRGHSCEHPQSLCQTGRGEAEGGKIWDRRGGLGARTLLEMLDFTGALFTKDQKQSTCSRTKKSQQWAAWWVLCTRIPLVTRKRAYAAQKNKERSPYHCIFLKCEFTRENKLCETIYKVWPVIPPGRRKAVTFLGSVFYNSDILGVKITNTSKNRRANIKFTSVTEPTSISLAPNQATVASLSQSGSIPWDWMGGAQGG